MKILKVKNNSKENKSYYFQIAIVNLQCPGSNKNICKFIE